MDYDALAKKHGAISPEVDYDALAAQHGAVQETTKADRGKESVSISGTAEVMGDQAKRAASAAWEYLNPANIGSAVFHPIDTLQNAFNYTSDAIGRVREAKDLKEAAMSLAGTVPIAGPQFEQITREIDSGHYAEAIGHAGAMLALSKTPEIAKGTGKAAGAATGKVVEIAKKPGAVPAAGAAVAFATGHPIIGSELAALALGRHIAGKASAVIEEAPKPRTPLPIEDFISAGKGAPLPDFRPPVEPAAPIQEPVQPPKVDYQGTQATTLAPKEAPAPEVPEVSEPVPAAPQLPRHDPMPIRLAEAEFRRGLVQKHLLPVIDHESGEVVAFAKNPKAKAAAEALAEAMGNKEGVKVESNSPHPPPEAYEGTYRAKRAQVIANHLHEHGLDYETAGRITPESLTESQWETILGKDPETGNQFRKPSQKTLDQARLRLAHKYAAGRNSKAAEIAAQLSAAMGE